MKIPRPATLIALLALALAAMFAISRCSHRLADKPLFASAGDYPPKSGDDTLDVAIEISPLSYSLHGDSVSGLDYELLNGLARKYGLHIKYHAFAPLDWAVKGLEQGTFDILVSSLQSTSALKKRLPVTESVYIDRQVLVQNRDKAPLIKSPEQLGGDTVWIARNSPVAGRIANLAAEIGDTIIIDDSRALTAEHIVMLTAAGDVPRCVVGEGLARAMASKYPKLDISTPISFNQFQAWAVSPKKKALLTKLNAMLAAYIHSDEYRSISSRYIQETNITKTP